MKTAALAGLLAAGTSLAANAAAIDYHGNIEGLNAISITGKIDQGDAERFREVASTVTGYGGYSAQPGWPRR